MKNITIICGVLLCCIVQEAYANADCNGYANSNIYANSKAHATQDAIMQAAQVSNTVAEKSAVLEQIAQAPKITSKATQQDIIKQNPFYFEASYVGDVYGNAVGGLKAGGGYMGMGNLKVGFDTEKVRWWKGGSFFINGATIHGKSLSENFVGDLQIVSNIDAGMYVYMHELWFRQEFKKFSFTVGLQDLNADFLASF